MLTIRKMMKSKKGFTLIELIVVIAILGILAAIAIPRFGGVQETANKKSVVANLKTIDNAIQVYATDKNIPVSAVTVGLLKGEASTDPEIAADTANALIPAANWPQGPAGITYEIVAGVPHAKVPAKTKGFIDAGGNYILDPTETDGIKIK